MSRERGIKTTFSKGVVIFASICFVCSIGLILLFALTKQEFSISLTVYICCGIFSVISLILLLCQLGNNVEVTNEFLYSRILFVSKRVKISKISEIEYRKEIYYVILKNGTRFASINSFDPMAKQILFELERKGVKVN